MQQSHSNSINPRKRQGFTARAGRRIQAGRIFCAVLAAACAAQAQLVDGGKVVSVGPNNALSPQQALDGYQLMWNGKDFTGWKSWQSAAPGTNWAIVAEAGLENNAKKSQSADSNIIEVAGAGESIWTVDTAWQDYDLEVEWMAPADLAGNSGILTRYSEKAGKNNNASAAEYQLCNSKWSEWTDSNTTAGAAYEMYPLQKSRRATDWSPTWTQAAGHWNQSRIVCYGRHFAHYGNGLKLVEYNMLTPDWNARYQKSKYSAYPYYATVHPGSVFIQDHGQPYMKFRNLKIKKLTSNPWGPTSPYAIRAAGDTTLLDTLSYLTDLYPGPTALNSISPMGRQGMRVEADAQGLALRFGAKGNYSVRALDALGRALGGATVIGSDRADVTGANGHSLSGHGPAFLDVKSQGNLPVNPAGTRSGK